MNSEKRVGLLGRYSLEIDLTISIVFFPQYPLPPDRRPCEDDDPDVGVVALGTPNPVG